MKILKNILAQFFALFKGKTDTIFQPEVMKEPKPELGLKEEPKTEPPKVMVPEKPIPSPPMPKPKPEPKLEPKPEPKPEPIKEEKIMPDGNKAAFQTVLKLVLKYEGGYVDHPDDPGGATNKGVTFRVYDAYRKNNGLPTQSVKNITDKEVEEIYFNRYWLKGKCDKLPSKIAAVHFDTVVNVGTKQGAKLLQRSVGAVDDGFIGSKTLETVNAKDESQIVKSYLDQRRQFYRNLAEKSDNYKTFLKGWLSRVDHLEETQRMA